MTRLSFVRLARRLLVEVALTLFTVAVTTVLWSVGALAEAVVALAAGLVGCALGTFVLHRSGALHLAARCPRLDALGLEPAGRDAPWDVLAAADAALATLASDARGYRGFFPEARRHLISSATRALGAHRLLTRVRRALADAPPGAARSALEAQELRALQELAALTSALKELRARFIADTAPLPGVEDPLPWLRELERQSSALGEAVEELSIHPGRAPVRNGGLS